MCGFFVVKSKHTKINVDDANRALSSLAHRGPDSMSYHMSSDTLYYGHVRLAIEDQSSVANQPFSDITKRYNLVFNGELYNFIELKEELTKIGCVFRSKSDTEVLLYGLINYGISFLKKIVGTYAFVFLDLVNNEIIAARDLSGKKPLYYSHLNDQIIFSSEIRSIPLYTKRTTISTRAIVSYLSLGFIPSNHTIFSDINSLDPGSVATITGGNFSIAHKDMTNTTNAKLSYKKIKKQVRQDIFESTRVRIPKNVDFALMLSGGLDSTIVSNIIANDGYHFTTFTASFKTESNDDLKLNNDLRVARETANRLGQKHIEVEITNDLVSRVFSSFINSMDQPNANPTCLTTFILGNVIKKSGFKVVFTGAGGDELFLGYNRYRTQWILDKLRSFPMHMQIIKSLAFIIPKFYRNQINSISERLKIPSENYSELYLSWRQLFKLSEIKSLLNINNSLVERSYKELHQLILKNCISSNRMNNVVRLSLLDFKLWIVAEDNIRTDNMLMANSIEARSPFLDTRLVERYLLMNNRDKYGVGNKKLLRSAFSDWLKKKWFHGKKYGFFSPARSWLKTIIATQFDGKFEDVVAEKNIFNSEFINSIFSNNYSRSAKKIWSILILLSWIRSIENQYDTQIQFDDHWA